MKPLPPHSLENQLNKCIKQIQLLLKEHSVRALMAFPLPCQSIRQLIQQDRSVRGWYCLEIYKLPSLSFLLSSCPCPRRPLSGEVLCDWTASVVRDRARVFKWYLVPDERRTHRQTDSQSYRQADRQTDRQHEKNEGWLGKFRPHHQQLTPAECWRHALRHPPVCLRSVQSSRSIIRVQRGAGGGGGGGGGAGGGEKMGIIAELSAVRLRVVTSRFSLRHGLQDGVHFFRHGRQRELELFL